MSRSISSVSGLTASWTICCAGRRDGHPHSLAFLGEGEQAESRRTGQTS